MMEEEQQLFHPDEETVVWPDKVDISQLCRICANSSEYLIPIFDGEGMENELELKIKKHLPIKISKEDPLPMSLCYQCASTLIAWHDLTLGCIEADKRLRDLADFKEERSSQSKMYEGDGLESIRGVSDIEIEFEEEVTTTPSTSAQVEFLDESDTPEKGNKRCVLKPLVKEESEQKQNQVTEDETEGNTSVIESTSDERSFLSFREFENTLCALRQKLMKLQNNSCTKCGKMFTSAYNLEVHLSLHNNQQTVLVETNLEECKEMSNNESDEETIVKLNQINKSKKKKIYKCDLCEREFGRRYDLKRHSTVQCTDLKEVDNIKDETEITILKVTDINQFMTNSKQNKVFSCETCGRFFRLKDSYERHKRIHTGERPFGCNECGKRFTDSGGLSRHTRDVHAKIRKHPCDFCNKWFANRATLEDHRRTHTGERPFVCHSCGQMFKSKAALYIHNKLHVDVFPHQCVYCGKCFRRKQEMLSHSTTHTGERPHICDKCGRCFRIRGELIRHIVIHSDEKPFVCVDCGLRFRQKRYLKNHAKSRHGRTDNIDNDNIMDMNISFL